MPKYGFDNVNKCSIVYLTTISKLKTFQNKPNYSLLHLED